MCVVCVCVRGSVHFIYISCVFFLLCIFFLFLSFCTRTRFLGYNTNSCRLTAAPTPASSSSVAAVVAVLLKQNSIRVYGAQCVSQTNLSTALQHGARNITICVCSLAPFGSYIVQFRFGDRVCNRSDRRCIFCGVACSQSVHFHIAPTPSIVFGLSSTNDQPTSVSPPLFRRAYTTAGLPVVNT